jgi:hypothetical protein
MSPDGYSEWFKRSSCALLKDPGADGSRRLVDMSESGPFVEGTSH